MRNHSKKIILVIQARQGSSRLKNKVLKNLFSNVTLLELVIKRAQKATLVDEVVVATGERELNREISKICQQVNVRCIFGSEQNVLERFVNIAKSANIHALVRVTADCPFVDPDIIDEAISIFRTGCYDYVSNTSPPTYPDGLDIEVFSAEAIIETSLKATNVAHTEHVTTLLRKLPDYRNFNLELESDFSNYRWTIDENIDLHVIKEICRELEDPELAKWNEILATVKKAPEKYQANEHIIRNQGALMTDTQKKWIKAKSLIPGGNMLLSKRPEMFLPEKWPTYYKKASGCSVWDLEGNHFKDLCSMGVGTNILGYANSEVDSKVINAIKDSTMSTLNCFEEVLLAEKLTDMHPWSDMVKFARSGGEANSIAIRIARAASGRTGVAFCGYHGWHDWYLSANLKKNDALGEHLLPGLSPVGVPDELKGTSFPFKYNDIDALKEIISRNSIGVIKMEVMRFQEPNDDFLASVRKIADDQNIVLIFDECTSGFRANFGGLHLKYGVTPDLAIFGKALGNGYPITAVIGKREVMENAQSTFISSTFWTDRIGPVAALASLEQMEKTQSWEHIQLIGNYLRIRLKDLAISKGIACNIQGLSSLFNYTINKKNDLIYKSLITQNLLEKGYLATTSHYLSIAHDEQTIDQFVSALEETFEQISQIERGAPPETFLESEICHSGFNRLN